ncbi:MAG: molecular chaperone TorD family protein [Coriobacteriales bacterium]|nr:molecular chaperone TorD family protein [Coriobacteriales bacterium]
MNDFKPAKEVLLAASLTFAVLGKSLYQELSVAELEQLLQAQVFTGLPYGAAQEDSQRGIACLSEWTRANSEGLSQESLDAIRHDYLYLFAGVGHPGASPWESTYFNEARATFAKQTLEVRDWYKRYGLMIERKNREPDDAIGYELSFVAHLAQGAATALASAREADYEEHLQALRGFLTEHLLRWAFIWSDRVQQNARSDFYRGLALLVCGSLKALWCELGEWGDIQGHQGCHRGMTQTL